MLVSQVGFKYITNIVNISHTQHIKYYNRYSTYQEVGRWHILPGLEVGRMLVQECHNSQVEVGTYCCGSNCLHSLSQVAQVLVVVAEHRACGLRKHMVLNITVLHLQVSPNNSLHS